MARIWRTTRSAPRDARRELTGREQHVTDNGTAPRGPIGVGIVGLSGPQTWAAQAHRRAILATPEL